MEPLRGIWNFICENKLYFLGGAVGLLVGILMLTIGFFATLLLLLLTAGGAVLAGNGTARAYLKAWIVQAYRYITKRG